MRLCWVGSAYAVIGHRTRTSYLTGLGATSDHVWSALALTCLTFTTRSTVQYKLWFSIWVWFE